MAVFKCKMCGATLEITEGSTICECDYCGTTQTIPRLSDDRKANLYDRANHFRRNNDFDKAMSIYENILNEDPTDAEAYWSLVLCRYGIEYVEDPASHKRIPTVNRAQYTSIYADENYKAALEHADALQKTIYEQEAKAIDEIQKGILEISAKEEPFDIFICYKETDSNGRRTQDSVLANDLYHQLTQEGFKVFFSRITLEDKLGVAYEPYIFAALNSAKVMVVLGTRPEYFSAVWVKNEWSRYLALIKSGQKKMLIPAYRDMDPYDLPEEFSHLQAQDMSKLGFMQDLIRGIKKIMEADAPKVQKETVVIQQNTSVNNNVQALLKRGQMALEDREWEKADGFFEEVLNQDAENGEAYLGKFLASKKNSSLYTYSIHLRVITQNATSEKLAACQEETAHIEEKAAELRVIGLRNENDYLSMDQIREYYKFDRTYSSDAKDRKEQKERILAELRRDRLYSRVKQYANGKTEKNVRDFEEKLNRELDERIEEATEKAAEQKEKVTVAYKAHIDSADQKVMEAHRQAVERKENIYQDACSLENQGQLALAAEAFYKLGDYKDSSVRKKELDVMIVEKTNEDAYKKACYLETSGKIRLASEAFYKLGDYKDSAIRKKELDERIAQEDREAEARQIENVRREKAKAVRNGIITGAVIIAAIVFLVVLVKVIIPGNKYKSAEAAIANNKYDEAIEIFTALGEYKDAADRILETKYLKAEWLAANNEYADAYQVFKTLGSYSDSIEKAEESQTMFLKSASKGSSVYLGEYNGKTIEWQVLDVNGGKMLLISRYILLEKAYNESGVDITWEKCSIRRWLNGDFYQKAFADSEKSIITETTIKNADHPDYGTEGGKDTSDRVFLLSIEEFKTYLSGRGIATYEGNSDGSWWWLRSPGHDSDSAVSVYDDGSVHSSGYGVCFTGGIRPALWIDISNLE